MPEIPPPTLDYQSPQTVIPRPIFSWMIFIISLVLLGVFHLACIFTVPQYESIFRDFRMALPAATVMLLDASRFMGTPLGLLVWIAPVGLGFFAPLILPNPNRPVNPESLRRMLRILIALMVIFLGILLIYICIWICLYLPMNRLLQAVSGNK